MTLGSADDRLVLVGDNPFLGISHLSQERARTRGLNVTKPAEAVELLSTALSSGANGFLFSVSDPTLAILDAWRRSEPLRPIALYAIAPYAYEHVRTAVRLGGLPGLLRDVGSKVVRSRNGRAVAMGIRGFIGNDPSCLLKAYMSYELARVRAAAGGRGDFVSLLIHELVTDMALGLEMDWVFRAHVDFAASVGLKPGFNTSNLPYLVQRFEEWKISLEGCVIAAPFNAEGFQMSPSREECERVLADLNGVEVIGFSILAAGHLDYSEAIEYVTSLPNLTGVAVGVSKMEHARSTFKRLRESYEGVAA
jgi:hypothetical protein